MSTDKSSKQSTSSSEEVLDIEVKPVVKTRKPRRVVDKASVDRDFDVLCNFVCDEIERIRASANSKPPTRSGVKFLRSVNKRVKLLRKDAERAFKLKPKTKRNKNSCSGFMKPVKISDELADFAGWEHGVDKSRVEATKFICAYIKEKDLQNPADRRKILPDDALKVLLSYDPETAKHPLTYFRIQTCIQRHFPESKKNRDAAQKAKDDAAHEQLTDDAETAAASSSVAASIDAAVSKTATTEPASAQTQVSVPATM